MELSIDTSSNLAGVAVSDQGRLVAEMTWRTAANHTVELMPAIDMLLSKMKVAYSDLKGIVVALGPGSFNGLRVGISAAKGLCASLSLPVAGVGTLEVEAWPFAVSGLPVCPVHDAGRGELAVALFSGEDGVWRCHDAGRLVRTDELIATITRRTILCGEIPDKVEQALSQALGGLAVFPPEDVRLRRMACLAALGRRQLDRMTDDPATLQPVYLRQPNITRPRKEYAA